MKTIFRGSVALWLLVPASAWASSFDVCHFDRLASETGEWFGAVTTTPERELVFVRRMDADILQKGVTQRQVDLDETSARARAAFRSWFDRNVEHGGGSRIFVVRSLETSVRNCGGRWFAGFHTDASALGWVSDPRDAGYDLLPATREFLKNHAVGP